MNPEPASLIDALARRWRRRTRLALAFRVLAAGLPVCALLAVFASVPWHLLGLALVAVTAAILVVHGLRPESCARELVRHLDRAVPELQESSELLLASRERLNLLERLQHRRLLEAVRHLDAPTLLPWRGVRAAARWLTVSAAASAALWLWTPVPSSDAVERAASGAASSPALPADATVLRSVEVAVEPPAYTGRPARTVTDLDLQAEEGARLTWTLTTTPQVDRAELIFDQATLALEEKGDGRFTAEATAESPRLYYVRLASAGKEVFRSPYARLEVVPDAPPVLDVLAPEPFVEVDPEHPGKLELTVEASDDYGLGETAIRATLASGTGEMVEFREQHYELTSRVPLADHALRLGRVLDLEALGVEPGSELYFFVEAFDNREPEPNHARTATHIVRAPGGAGLSVELGEGIPMITLPDYFRSQRQIIIDTEKLIADHGTITEKEFRQRSQELGFDQGALRTRYGALLGLESEDGRPMSDREIAATEDEEPDDGDDDEHDHAGEEGEFESEEIQRLMEELPEDLIHLHDSAEVSTFFTSEVKTLLKAAIRQMWDSELHLRLFEPGEALPFENRALRLLKAAQQAQRVYVQHVGFDAPVVKPQEKRLTGELDDIESQRHRFATETTPALPEVRRALEIVDERRRDPASTPADFADVMEAAARVLARRALEERDVELAALDALRQWITTGEASAARLATIERALWRLLPEPAARPAPREAAAGSLYRGYRRRLGDGGG